MPSNDPDLRRLLTVPEAAEYLAISKALVYRMVANQEIDHVRVGVGRGTIRFHQTHLDRYKRGRES
jgi:excisionase family DNA binding protein